MYTWFVDPSECQDGVTNNCSQNCTRRLLNETVSHEYKCICDAGFAANHFGFCKGENLCAYWVDYSYNVIILTWGTNMLTFLLDIDECQDSNFHNCSKHAKCINRDGSFVCHCKIGYDGDGTICTCKSLILSNHYYNAVFVYT